MKILTDFGDSGVLLPLSVVLLVWLLAMRSRAGAAWWLIAVAGCIGVTTVMKIYFSVCPVGIDLKSPSGHSSFSTLAYGGLAVIVAAEAGKVWQRSLVVGGVVALIAGIAASRLMLDAHSMLEIVLGLLIGLVSLAVFAWAYRSHRPLNAAVLPLLGAVVLVMALLHGGQLHAEQLIHSAGTRFHFIKLACF